MSKKLGRNYGGCQQRPAPQYSGANNIICAIRNVNRWCWQWTVLPPLSYIMQEGQRSKHRCLAETPRAEKYALLQFVYKQYAQVWTNEQSSAEGILQFIVAWNILRMEGKTSCNQSKLVWVGPDNSEVWAVSSVSRAGKSSMFNVGILPTWQRWLASLNVD